MVKIIITGGSGNVGTIIQQAGNHKGFSFNNISRNVKQKNDYKWDINKQYVDPNAFTDVATIIHLAGAGIADKRWTDSYKKEIYDSRILSTKLLFDYCYKNKIKIDHFISTSATGIYPNPGSALNENANKGNSYLAKVCLDWEKEALRFKELGSNVSILRTGIVLQNEGGFLPAVTKTKALKLFPTTGSPNNMVSWIHVQDLVNLYLALADGTLEPNIYNATAPNPVNQKEIMQTIANKFGGGFSPNVPGFVLKLAMGESALLATTNQNILPYNALNKEFNFKFKTIQQAIADLL